MKSSNWALHWSTRKKVEELKGSSHKMKTATDRMRSNCILEILNTVKGKWLLLKKLKYRLGIKSIQNARSRIVRDIFGKEIIAANPLFSENQIAEICSKHWQSVITSIGFTIAESFLYYLTACLFVPGGSEYMKMGVAIFLALLIMLAVGYSLEKHFLYFEALERFGKKEISDHQLRHYRHTRNSGYILLVFCFAAILFSGLSRTFFLENISAHGMDPAKQHSVQLASEMASIFTMLITFIAAFYMGVTKHEQVQLGVKYDVYHAWHVAHRRRNRFTRILIKAAHSILYIVEQEIEKYWQLILDLRGIHKDTPGHDEAYADLHQEYIVLASAEGFRITDDIYRRFAPIQSAHEELFRYGIIHHPHIQEKLAAAREILSIPEEHLAEHLAAIVTHKHRQLLLTAPSSNGIAKNEYQPTLNVSL